MVSRGNRAPNPLPLPYAPKLLKRLRSINTRLVVPRRLVDVVSSAVAGDGAFLGRAGGRVVGAVGLDDVVFDERVACPAVQRDVRVYVGCVPGTAVGYGATRARVPAFSCDEVADVGPGYVVFAACLLRKVSLGEMSVATEMCVWSEMMGWGYARRCCSSQSLGRRSRKSRRSHYWCPVQRA